MKTCTKCNIEKEEIEFNKNKSRNYKDGLNSWCKTCCKELRIANKDKIKQYFIKNKNKIKQYFIDNKEKINKWYKDNKEKISKKKKEYKQLNQDKIRIYSKNYYKKNKESINKKGHEYAEKNKNDIKKRKQQPKIKEKRNKRHNKKYKTNINYKLSFLLRGRFRVALKNNYKTGSAIRDLGCSIDDFKIYMESKFYSNAETGEMMTWENQHLWHIDHIRPLSSFDLTDPKQVKIACHYTNLQPLWAKENLSKGDKYEEKL